MIKDFIYIDVGILFGWLFYLLKVYFFVFIIVISYNVYWMNLMIVIFFYWDYKSCKGVCGCLIKSIESVFCWNKSVLFYKYFLKYVFIIDFRINIILFDCKIFFCINFL